VLTGGHELVVIDADGVVAVVLMEGDGLTVGGEGFVN
jgi:hypothetical protein